MFILGGSRDVVQVTKINCTQQVPFTAFAGVTKLNKTGNETRPEPSCRATSHRMTSE